MEAGDYWETSLTVEAGYELQLTGITVSFGGPKSGPTTCQLAWSTDDKKTWTYLRELELPRTSTTYFVNSLSESELEDLETGTVWFRLVAWGGGTPSTAVGSFGKGGDGLVFEGEVIETEDVLPTVRFRPAEPLAYVGEMLTVSVKARPSGAKLTSITVNPNPEGIVTPNLPEWTWAFVPVSADFNKTFVVTVGVSNKNGEATGNVEVQVKGTVAEENGVTWRFCIDEETATVTGAYPVEGELIIPSSLAGYPVTSIGESTFSNCSGLTNVTIPDSVSAIGASAFAACNGLTSLTIPDSVTNVADKAFAACSGLTSVTIPQAVCAHPLSMVFPDSYQLLTNVIFGTTVTNIGYKAFSECSGLMNVTIPDSVTTIGASAFTGCSGLTSLMIPKSVTTIEASAFAACNGLTNVTLGENLKSIGDSAFSGCTGLTSVVLPDSMKSIGKSAFSGCSGLVQLKLSAGLTTIPNGAFANCLSLDSATIPHNVGIIESYAFEGCSALSSLDIGNGVGSIGSNAFARCSSLETVTIPKQVVNLGGGAFSDCHSLTSVLFLGYLKNASSYSSARLFTGCSKLETIAFGGNATTVRNYLCMDLTNLASVVLAPTITNIGLHAFSGCSSLSALQIPDGTQNLGDYCLKGCSALTSLSIPNSVTNVGTDVFDRCQSLSTLYVPASWEGTDMLGNASVPSSCEIVYGENEDQDSEGTEIIDDVSWTFSISNSEASIVHASPAEGNLVVPFAVGGYLVTSIGDHAFSDCDMLGSLTIPDSITRVGADVFSDCDSLNELRVPAWWMGTDILVNASVPDSCEIVYGQEDLNSEIIDGVTWFYIESNSRAIIVDVFPILENLLVPSVLGGLPVEDIGPSAFAGCNDLKSATLPESVIHIGQYAFHGCSTLEEVTILGNVTNDWKKEDDNLFSTCFRLNTVFLGENMTKIGNYMFDQCGSLQSLTIPDSITSIGNRSFGFCESLAWLEFGQGLVSIGSSSFRACTALKSVFIPDNVTHIGDHAFYQCSGLEEVSLGNSIRQIATGTFRDCPALLSISLPDELERINAETFYNCSSLPTLRIPSNVTFIGSKAFYGCTSLETLWVPASWEGTDMLEETGVPDTCMICYYKPDTGDNETTTTPVPVPYDWLEAHAASILEATTNDYEAAANAPASNEMAMWECYLVGLDPENEGAAFTAKLEFVDGKPVVKWDPDLNEDGTKQERVYQVWARKSVEAPEPDGERTTDGWADVTGQEATWETNGWRFFRVGVDLPK